MGGDNEGALLNACCWLGEVMFGEEPKKLCWCVRN